MDGVKSARHVLRGVQFKWCLKVFRSAVDRDVELNGEGAVAMHNEKNEEGAQDGNLLESEDPSARPSEAHAALTEIRELRALVEERLRYDEAKEKAFSRMYADLDAARSQLTGDHLQPVFKALIQLYDHAKSSLDVVDGDGREHIEALCHGLLDTLYRLDVDMIQDTPERFDRKTQTVVRKAFTDNPEEDWTVESVVREGFQWHGKVIRPQEVAVRRIRQNV